MGMESAGKVASGLGIGCNSGLGIVYQILEFYASLRFMNSDGSYNLHTVVGYVTSILAKNGLKLENRIQKLEGLTIYPTEYFAPKSNITGKIAITSNTYSIHHYDASWVPEKERKYFAFKKNLCRLLGFEMGTFFAIPFFVFMNIKNHGIKKGINISLNKFFYSP